MIEQPWCDDRLKMNGVFIGCGSKENADEIMWMQAELASLRADNAEMREALMVASRAIAIANDWNIYDMQVEAPARWAIECEQENEEDGWCSTRGLAKFLRDLAEVENAPPDTRCR